jgi:hypothetical protein
LNKDRDVWQVSKLGRKEPTILKNNNLSLQAFRLQGTVEICFCEARENSGVLWVM